MFYCKFPEDKNLIRGYINPNRTVGRYLVVNHIELPLPISFQAHTIVALTPGTKDFYWYKHREKQDVMLTKEEQQELMLQVLKSENW